VKRLNSYPEARTKRKVRQISELFVKSGSLDRPE
jgi:hypothetical protein